MALENDVELLMGVPLLASLGRDALRILAIGAEQRRLQPNETLFREGEDADSAYLVVAGSILLRHTLEPKRGEVTAEVGALIGETALVTDVRRPVTAIARSEAQLLRIPRNTFLRTLEGYPEAAANVRRAFAQRVAQTVSELDDIRRRLQGGGY